MRGLPYSAESVKRPQYFGTLTNDIVWKRIAPGVLTELKRVIPKDAKGRGQATLAQALWRFGTVLKLRGSARQSRSEYRALWRADQRPAS
ncbi:P63C domain-containing protein [Bradyrhizobium lablabi]|uniref:P63C domain-containing protein n=1 Tax=Bradyrhizobium lablabi TaxID=722472 RepID=UPI0009A67E6F